MNIALQQAIHKTKVLQESNYAGSSDIESRLKNLEKDILSIGNRVSFLEQRMGEFLKWRKPDFRCVAMVIIMQKIELKTGETVRDLRSGRRSKSLYRARHMFQYLARKYTGCSTPQIGRFCNRDHSSVMHGIKRITTLRPIDPELHADLLELELILEKELG